METVIRKQLSDYIDNLQDILGEDLEHDSFVMELDHSYSGFCFFIDSFLAYHRYQHCDISFIDFAFVTYANIDAIDVYEEVDSHDMVIAIVSALADEPHATSALAKLINDYLSLSARYNNGNDTVQKQLRANYAVASHLAEARSEEFMDTYFDLMTA